MGRAEIKAKIRLEGDASGATKAIKKTESGFKRLGNTIKSGALAQIAAVAGVAVALRGMVRAITAAITASNKQADAVNALEGALAPLGDQVDRVSKSLQEQAAALQKVTTFGDEVIIEAQAMIASFVKDEEAIKAATIATIDLAEAKKFDLVAAADLVSKTLGSSTNALTRYGIEVTGAVGSTERLTTLTENVATVFGGRAAKATETFSGKVKQLSNAWGDLQENAGDAITENDRAVASIDELTEAVAKAGPMVGTLAISIVEFGAGAADAVKSVGLLREEVEKWNFVNSKLIQGLAQKRKALRDVTVGGYAKLYQATVGLLKLKKQENESVEQSGYYYDLLSQRMRVMLGVQEDFNVAQQKAVDRTARLNAETEKSATAMEKLGKALGIVTAAQLEAEIIGIEKAMREARDATQEFSQELIDAEAEGGRQIESLELRIDGLRDGVGDMGKEAANAALGFKELGDEIEDTGIAAEETGENFDGLTQSVKDTNSALSDQERQARATGRELVQLTAVAESLALAEARTALAATQEARKRITGTQGSRQQDNRSDYALSQFGTGGLHIVEPDGSMRPP